MDLKLNVQKRGLSTTAETINEEFTLHYGHIFKGEKGDKGADGKDGVRGADGKSAYQQAVEAGYKGSEEDFKELLLSYPNKADKEGYYPNMSVGIADDVKNGNTKYLAATPSGDPMHYAYEAAGAVWNNADADTYIDGKYGDTITHKSRHWLYNEVGDMTNEDMRITLSYPYMRTYNIFAYMCAGGAIRVNVPIQGDIKYAAAWGGSNLPTDIDGAFFKCSNIEVAKFFEYTDNDTLNISYFKVAFAFCSKLKKVLNTLNLSAISNNIIPFRGCSSLVDVRLVGVKADISFADSPLLSKESLLYMIDNCASDATFTITLHPDVDDKWQTEWLGEIDGALGRAESAKNTNITLARA